MTIEPFDAVLAEVRNSVWVDPDDLDRLAAAHAPEVVELRETNRRMNRRVQMAEAAVPSYRKLIAIPPDGDGVRFADGNFGRKLLTWYCEQLTERAEAAERDARGVRDTLREAPGVLAYAMNLCNELASDALQDEALRQISAYNAKVRAAISATEAAHEA